MHHASLAGRSILVLCLSLLAIAGPLAVGASEASGAVAIDDLVRMLEEGIPADVVLTWLENRPGTVASPDPDDLIRLRRAGADEALLRLVVERSGTRPPAVPPSPVPTTVADAGGDARIDLELEYRPVGAWEGDERARVPDLVLFVDGRTLARIEPQGDIGRQAIRFRSRWPAGPHVVRWGLVVEERGATVLQVSPDAIAFEPDAGPPWTLRYRWIESALALGPPDPLSWELLRDGEPIARGGEGATTRPGWRELCDDLTAALGDDEPSRRDRRRLESCVSWSDWWDGVERAPTRADVRDDAEPRVGRPFDGPGEEPGGAP